MTAAKLVGGYWNRLVRLDDERLAKQAFSGNWSWAGWLPAAGGYSTLGRPGTFFSYGGSHCLRHGASVRG